MSTVPKITIEQAKIICANPANADLWMVNQNQMIEAYNKALEKQQRQQNVKDLREDMLAADKFSTPTVHLKKYSGLSNQQESEYITAAQARELGDGNAEYQSSAGVWKKLDHDFYTHASVCDDLLKYRAIKQAQPEPVDPHAELRAEYIRQRDAVPCELGFYLWEFGGNNLTWIKCDAAPLFIPVYQYRCTDISCYVSKDGDTAIRMLRTEAQELQRKLGDTVWWSWLDVDKLSSGQYSNENDFSRKGTYTYRTKATIKLDGNMVTPEQAAAEWEAKKESHQLWFKFKDYKWEDVIGYPENMVEYFKDSSSIFELRPKQPTWTGSREDVIALLKELEVLK